MKTTQTKRSKPDRKPQAISGLNKADNALAVIRDASNGKEYFLSIIDSFSMAGRDYVVMYNYEPDDGNHADPELVIMRTEYANTGEQYFFSIKDNHELDVAFSLFMNRFQASSAG
jgi:uncharacterized protein YrzB (UPF0473 family)